MGTKLYVYLTLNNSTLTNRSKKCHKVKNILRQGWQLASFFSAKENSIMIKAMTCFSFSRSFPKFHQNKFFSNQYKTEKGIASVGILNLLKSVFILFRSTHATCKHETINALCNSHLYRIRIPQQDNCKITINWDFTRKKNICQRWDLCPRSYHSCHFSMVLPYLMRFASLRSMT